MAFWFQSSPLMISQKKTEQDDIICHIMFKWWAQPPQLSFLELFKLNYEAQDKNP